MRRVSCAIVGGTGVRCDAAHQLALSINWAVGLESQLTVLDQGLEETRSRLLTLFIYRCPRKRCQHGPVRLHPGRGLPPPPFTDLPPGYPKC